MSEGFTFLRFVRRLGDMVTWNRRIILSVTEMKATSRYHGEYGRQLFKVTRRRGSHRDHSHAQDSVYSIIRHYSFEVVVAVTQRYQPSLSPPPIGRTVRGARVSSSLFVLTLARLRTHRWPPFPRPSAPYTVAAVATETGRTLLRFVRWIFRNPPPRLRV